MMRRRFGDSHNELAELADANGWVLTTLACSAASKCRVITVQLAWPLKLGDLESMLLCLRWSDGCRVEKDIVGRLNM